MILTDVGKRQINVICSSCGQQWETPHRCDVPPEIDFAHYSDVALERLLTHLTLILAGRRRPPQRPLQEG